MAAAEKGHDAVIRQLLGRKDVNPNLCTSYNYTALIFAAENGNDAVVRFLLERDDAGADYALYAAASNGHEAVVRLLVERTYGDMNATDKALAKALSTATIRGHDSVIARALGFNGFKVDLIHLRCSLLFQAAKDGDDNAILVLLNRYNFDPNSKNMWGETALTVAAENGHEALVRLLLGRPDINPDSRDDRGRTALWLAAKNGHTAVVRLLLERNEVDLNVNVDGDTPLMVAAGNGHEEVVRLLLGKDKIDPHFPNGWDQTPLWRAASNGHIAIVQLLLGNANSNIGLYLGALLYNVLVII